jgi:hypothetical protein
VLKVLSYAFIDAQALLIIGRWRSQAQFRSSSFVAAVSAILEIEVSNLYRRDLSTADATDLMYRVLQLRNVQPIQFFSCFISYSHEDKQFATRLYDGLQSSGIRCWLDERQLSLGDDIYEEVDRGIRLWDKVLLCCSSSSLGKSWWVDKEIKTAFEKEQELHRERGKTVRAIIPLNLDDFMFSNEWKGSYRAEIRSRVTPRCSCLERASRTTQRSHGLPKTG